MTTSHETTTESQRTVTSNCCDDNGLGAALDSAMDTPPTEPGMYYVACEETAGAWQVLRVDYPLGFQAQMSAECFGLWRGDTRPAVLYVLCPDLGMTRLSVYHDGLTNPRWLRAEPNEQDADGWCDTLRALGGYPPRLRVVQGGKQP